MLSNRNCFKLLVKMIATSPIARCPSFKFLTMQMEPSASWARNCGSFYPRPPRSQTSRTVSTDELISAQRFRALARLRHADEHQGCPLIGVERKGPADGQSDANDPQRTTYPPCDHQ